MAPTKILQYEEENMLQALAACNRGTAVSTAAKMFKVPRSSLNNKIKGLRPISRKMGASTIFTANEEKLIVKNIFHLANSGFPPSKINFLHSIRKLAIELKKKNFTSKDGMPSKSWYHGFMARHPSVSERMAQNLTASRSAVNQEKLTQWQNEVENYLKEENLLNTLQPNRVYNCDETAFFLNPKAGKVLAPRGSKTIYTCAGNDEKENITVLLNSNAEGTLAPPMIIFRYKRIPSALTENIPAHWAIGRSESGWMDCENFYEYIANIFSPWLTKNKIERPVILFLDGHVSHLSLELSAFTMENKIILIALLPNATHLLQPCDVALFHSLKSHWKTAVQRFRIDEGKQVTKFHFPKLLNKILEEMYRPEIMKNGFRTCGLCPWDKSQVKVSRSSHSEQDRPIPLTTTASRDELQFLFWFESRLGKEKIRNFKQGVYEARDVGLYEFWMNIQPTDYEVVADISPTNAEGPSEPSQNYSICDGESSLTAQDLIEEWPNQNNPVCDGETTVTAQELTTEWPSQNNPVCDGETSLTAQELAEEWPSQNSPICDDELSLTAQELADERPSQNNPVCDAGLSLTAHQELAEEVPSQNNPICDELSLTAQELADERPSQNNSVCDAELSLTAHQELAEEVPTQNNPICDGELSLTAQELAEEGPSKNNPVCNKGSSSNVSNDDLIPSPFKRAMFWPGKKETKGTKRKYKEKIPAVVSSEQYQLYYEKKSCEKKEKEEAKIARIAARKLNKEKKDKEKKMKVAKKLTFSEKRKAITDSSEDDNDEGEEVVESSSDSSDENTNEHNWVPVQRKKGTFVIVKYDDKFFPGKIVALATDGDGANVSAMQKLGASWKWPKTPDVLFYKWEDIVSSIAVPLKTSRTRDLYIIPELSFQNIFQPR